MKRYPFPFGSGIAKTGYNPFGSAEGDQSPEALLKRYPNRYIWQSVLTDCDLNRVDRVVGGSLISEPIFYWQSTSCRHRGRTPTGY